MNIVTRHRALLAAILALLLCATSPGAQGLRGNLVSARWLAQSLADPDVLVLDASFAKAYAEKHIPGAVSVDIFKLMSFGIREMPAREAEKTYQSLGIGPGRKVVIYDQGGTWEAARVLYALEYHGFPVENLFLLDGGLSKWEAEGLAVTKDATPAARPGTFTVTKTRESVRARLPEFLAASGDPKNNVLLDALGPEMHYGQTRFFDKAGHVPNAVLLPADDFFNADRTWKSPEEIRRMLAYYSIVPERQVYAHCGGGGAAAVPYFALKFLANHPNVKLYPESQMGWLHDERDLPFWTYGAPHLMRDTDWLSAWGGRMMRMYGASSVSVVDVRTPEAYRQAHLPFSINVPADVFRAGVDDPAKLAQALGSAGVDPDHEAVLVSGAGLTRESALAFLMLEKMGQRKVSIFTESLESPDSLDRMAGRGFAVTKDARPASATRYPAAAGNAGSASAKSADGAFPKVYIASGASVPARAPAGKVVHVPYTQLLKSDGTPKEAKDIWAILAKAGVPRYAQIVLFSDDPGEAAVNYFVFRLMGFPDAKVLSG